jgi:hypothetical protein
LSMLFLEGYGLRVHRALRTGTVEVSIVSGYVDSAKITLQIRALRASHLVASIAFDEGLLAFVAVADEGLTSGFLNFATMADGGFFVALALVFIARVRNVSSLFTFATAGDVAGRRLTMQLKVDVDGWADGLEVAVGAALNIINASGTKIVLLTQTHEVVYQRTGIRNQTKLGFPEGVITTVRARTSKLRAALSDFGSKICLHAIETHRVLVCRAASDDFVRSILIITGRTVKDQQRRQVQERD